MAVEAECNLLHVLADNREDPEIAVSSVARGQDLQIVAAGAESQAISHGRPNGNPKRSDVRSVHALVLGKNYKVRITGTTEVNT